MKELFQQQFEYGTPITEELLNELPQKTYTSGEEKQVNDVILYGFKVNFFIGAEDKEELSLDLFSLCEREFPYYSELYTVIKNPFGAQFNMPIFVKKGEEDKFQSMKHDYLN